MKPENDCLSRPDTEPSGGSAPAETDSSPQPVSEVGGAVQEGQPAQDPEALGPIALLAKSGPVTRPFAAPWRAIRSRFTPPNAPLTGIPWWLSVLFMVLGGLAPFCIMAMDRRLIVSVPVGFVGLSLAGMGLWGVLGSLGNPTAAAQSVSARSLLLPVLRLTASVLALVIAGRAVVDGSLPAPRFSAGVLFTLTFVWIVVETFRVATALGIYRASGKNARSLLRRQGFWLVVFNALLHLPMLGSFGLIDPWETHYGEVSREMLARDDWISLWWAHDGWFWSKPILNFWMQGLSFKLFGVQYMPDQMLAGIVEGRFPMPEWACRFPVFLLAVVAVYALYKGTAVAFGRRVALVGSLILSTCPYWYMVGRQTMADMPYVATLTAALGLMGLAFHTQPDAVVRQYPVRFGNWTIHFTGFHLLFAAVALCALPQALYLLTRNVTLHTGGGLFGFEPHLDQFVKGSGGGNCGEPGNAACKSHIPLYPHVQPFVFGLGWLSLTVALFAWYSRERRTQCLYFLGAWFFTALSVMAKGAPGLVIPLAVALVFPVVTGRFRDLMRCQFPAMVVLLLVVAFPWYIQMYMRHGQPFIERLIFHDMFKRAFMHVHDTNKGDDTSFRYYIWQLGYGLFPWTGFAALGITWLGRSNERRNDPKWTASIFLLCWWLVAFGMFTITLTKFHHYILPLVPPTAILAGVVLSQYLPKTAFAHFSGTLRYYGGLFVGAGIMCSGALLAAPGRLSGRVFNEQVRAGNWAVGLPLVVVGAGVAWFVAARFRNPLEGERELSELNEKQRYNSVVLSVLAIASTVPLFLAGRDLFTTRKGDVDGQARLIHLFTYNYDRKWPITLDFQGAFMAFTAMCVVFTLAMAVRRWRKPAAILLCSAATLFSAWVVNFYFVNLSPHWGQRETILAYYENRSGPEEQLVAYQMNWKGENFYTGNRMATFVSSGKKFKQWITKEREAGKTTFFFTTEHARINNLKKELGSPEDFELLTDETLNNKFSMARAKFPPLIHKAGAEDEGEEDLVNTPSNVGSGE